MAGDHLLGMLSVGDLRSDGLANEVVDIVLENEELFDDLYLGLADDEDVVRGHAADALEKIGRSRPDLLKEHLPELIDFALTDSVPMVRWHLAMALGHLALYEDRIGQILDVLVQLLLDESVFVRSWAIVSLTIIGRKYPQFNDACVEAISGIQWDASIALRTKVRKALLVLTHPDRPFPPGWVKSECIRQGLRGEQ